MSLRKIQKIDSLFNNATTVIHCSSQYNAFDGIVWDNFHVSPEVKLFKFTVQSADNDMSKLHIHSEDRIEDLGSRNKTKFSV